MTRLPLLLLLLAPGLPATAEVYRWTDEHGRVHFGDSAAGHPRNAERLAAPAVPADKRVDPAPRDSNDTADTSDARRARQQRLLQVLAQERAEKERQAQADAAREAEHRRRCRELRATLRDAEGRLLYVPGENGIERFLSEEERVAHLDELRRVLRENCS